MLDYGSPPRRAADWLIGLDVGQVRDPSAVIIAERIARPAPGPEPGPESFVTRLGLGRRPAPAALEGHYAVRHIERWLGVPYPEQVERVTALCRRLRDTLSAHQTGTLALVLDATGCGRPVADMFRQSDLAGVEFAAVTITGGDAVNAGAEWYVPKRILVSHLQVALQTGRLRVAAELADAATLEQELRGFRAKVTLSGHTRFEAGGSTEEWRGDGPHDDLVLATALAVWWGEWCLAGRAGLAEAFSRAAAWQTGG